MYLLSSINKLRVILVNIGPMKPTRLHHVISVNSNMRESFHNYELTIETMNTTMDTLFVRFQRYPY